MTEVVIALALLGAMLRARLERRMEQVERELGAVLCAEPSDGAVDRIYIARAAEAERRRIQTGG